MADLDSSSQSSSEKEEDERRKREKKTLDQEIAQKYDPARLRKMVVEGAGRGERLDLATRMRMERVIPGHDFSNVRVFRGAFAEEITARHKADAVTVANTGMILVRDSARSAPGTTAGQALLAHELTHVAQAQRGMHFALASEGGHGAHEEEAEAVEHSVAHGGAHSAAKAASSTEKDEARRKMVIELAMRDLHERGVLDRDRNGHGI